MLVVPRRIGASIVIGGGITVTVREVIGTKVRLGIEAPKNVRVLRSELVTFPTWGVEDRAPLTAPLS